MHACFLSYARVLPGPTDKVFTEKPSIAPSCLFHTNNLREYRRAKAYPATDRCRSNHDPVLSRRERRQHLLAGRRQRSRVGAEAVRDTTAARLDTRTQRTHI